MEHISRLTTNNVNDLLAVSDPTKRGLQAASRIIELAGTLGLRIDRKLVVVNRAKKGQDAAIEEAAKNYDLPLVGLIPEDQQLQEYDLNGRPTVELTEDNMAVNAAYRIFAKILNA
jgi:CO dehydrogenase maturation factor